MASAAILGHGTLLKMGDGAGSETFTTIAEVTDISPSILQVETVEVTSHDSPGKQKEYIAGLIEPGDVSLTINYIPTHTTHNATTGLLQRLKDRQKTNFQLVFPNGAATTFSFAAFVTGFNPQTPLGDKLSAEVTLKVAGSITLA